jgi:hypothetical protein
MRRTAHASPRFATLSVPLVALLALTSCTTSGGSPGPSDSGGGGGITHPAGDELVFRIEYTGGFVMPQTLFAGLPAFSMTGDGRVIVPGALIDIFPGPLMPAIQVRRLTEGGVQAVLQAVAATRQFGNSTEWRGAQNFIADASDTVFTLHADEQDVVVTVYGLGTVAGPGLEPPPNFPEAELAAHRVLQALVDRLTTIDSWLPESAWADSAWRPYQPDALRLLVRNADADPPDDTGIGNTEVEWPIAGDPAAFGERASLEGMRCGVVSGEDAAAWLAVLSTSNQLTRFTARGHRYEVTVRPLLPDEPETCPES